MSALYSIFSTGRTALMAQQQGISVTGHNIANVNTPGYTRQRLVLETNYPLDTQPGQMGTGVGMAEIQRVYDRYIDTQIRNETTSLGEWETYRNSMQRLERVFDEASGYGLNQAMTEFWNAWQDLSNNPGGQAERVALTTKSQSLTTTFRKIREDMVHLQQDADFSIGLTVDEVNDITVQIADLNEKIATAEAVGQSANDYRDKRDLLIGDLSKLVDVNSFETDDGQMTVRMDSGRALVQGNNSWALSTAPDGSGSGFHDVVWIDSNNSPVDITDQVAGGKIKGWLDSRDTAVPGYLADLDLLADTMIQEVNTLHSAGFGLIDGGTGLPYTGVDFFAGSSAADIAVHSTVINDYRAVAASATQLGVPGDNGNAVAIANLQSKLTMEGTPPTSTFDGYFNSMLGRLGSEVSGAENNCQYEEDMVLLLNNYRENISGVSLDEEMVELIEYQKGYEAAAKLIGTVDEMLDSLFSML